MKSVTPENRVYIYVSDTHSREMLMLAMSRFDISAFIVNDLKAESEDLKAAVKHVNKLLLIGPGISDEQLDFVEQELIPAPNISVIYLKDPLNHAAKLDSLFSQTLSLPVRLRKLLDILQTDSLTT